MKKREREKEAGQSIKKTRSHDYCTWFSNFPADSTTPISLALLLLSLSLSQSLCVQTGGRCVPEPGNSSGNQEPKKKPNRKCISAISVEGSLLGKRLTKKDSLILNLSFSSVQFSIDLGRNSTISAISNERKTLLPKK